MDPLVTHLASYAAVADRKKIKNIIEYDIFLGINAKFLYIHCNESMDA